MVFLGDHPAKYWRPSFVSAVCLSVCVSGLSGTYFSGHLGPHDTWLLVIAADNTGYSKCCQLFMISSNSSYPLFQVATHSLTSKNVSLSFGLPSREMTVDLLHGHAHMNMHVRCERDGASTSWVSHTDYGRHFGLTISGYLLRIMLLYSGIVSLNKTFNSCIVILTSIKLDLNHSSIIFLTQNSSNDLYLLSLKALISVLCLF